MIYPPRAESVAGSSCWSLADETLETLDGDSVFGGIGGGVAVVVDIVAVL